MKAQRIVLFGANGKIGQDILEVALNRGHYVTAIVNDAKYLKHEHINLKVVEDKIESKEDINKHAKGYDLVICAFEPTPAQAKNHILFTRSVIEGTKEAGVGRLFAVGHIFEWQIEDENETFEEWRSIKEAQRQVLRAFMNTKGLDWSYTHNIEPRPYAMHTPSSEVFISNSCGENKKALEKYGAALLDEIEMREYLWEENQLSASAY